MNVSRLVSGGVRPARYECCFEKFISLKNAFFLLFFFFGTAITWLHPSVVSGASSQSLWVCAVVSLKIFRRCKATGSMLDMVDSSSLLYRLEMDGKEESCLAHVGRAHEDTEEGDDMQLPGEMGEILGNNGD